MHSLVVDVPGGNLAAGLLRNDADWRESAVSEPANFAGNLSPYKGWTRCTDTDWPEGLDGEPLTYKINANSDRKIGFWWRWVWPNGRCPPATV